MYRASDTLDQHAVEQIGVNLGSRGEFDEGDNKRERVRFVRCFGLDLTDQILNRLEALLHGGQHTCRPTMPPITSVRGLCTSAQGASSLFGLLGPYEIPGGHQEHTQFQVGIADCLGESPRLIRHLSPKLLLIVRFHERRNWREYGKVASE
jgi:hypothetical protein